MSLLNEQYKNLRRLLIKHEGLRLKPYRCTAGKLTIGVGRNLEDVGISEQEALVLLNGDIERTVKETSEFSWYASLSCVRQDVVLSMVFNLGLSRFKGFVKLIECLQNGNFEGAAKAMLDSQWANQVGLRAQELAEMMRLDRYR